MTVGTAVEYSSLDTPSFVIDESQLRKQAKNLQATIASVETKLLYSLKALPFAVAVQALVPFVDGLSASSLFEAKLARRLARPDQTIHATAPAFRSVDDSEVVAICDFISANSLNQFVKLGQETSDSVKLGLRVNPMCRVVKDERYDPCAPFSKLGCSATDIAAFLRNNLNVGNRVSGLLVHNNCDSNDFSQLNSTVTKITNTLGDFLGEMDWFNLGGGYLFQEDETLDQLAAVTDELQTKYGLTTYMEPGAGMIRDCCVLVSSVVDLFTVDGKTIAILDTTVNHMPEVFEYQFQPDVAGDTEDGRFSAILAGCSCLAGDKFGEYSFDKPLEIGSRVVFENVGAYTMPKWHYFNGINLPSIYSITADGELFLHKEYTFEDYRQHVGGR